jgi:hypothetical protein
MIYTSFSAATTEKLTIESVESLTLFIGKTDVEM